MLKFETFIFKNGKALDLYSKDGEKTNKGKDIYVDARQTAGVLGVKYESLTRFLRRVAKQRTPDKLSGVGVKPVVNKGVNTIRLISFLQFNACCFVLYKGDGEAIAQELTDALAVYMTDAPTYERTQAILDGTAFKDETLKHPQPYNSNLITRRFGGLKQTTSLLTNKGWLVKTSAGYIASPIAIDAGLMVYNDSFQRSFAENVTGRVARVPFITPKGFELLLKESATKIDNQPLFANLEKD